MKGSGSGFPVPGSGFVVPPGSVEPPPGFVVPPPGSVEPPPGLVVPPPGLVEPPPGFVVPPPGLVEPPPGFVVPPGLVEPPGFVVPPPVEPVPGGGLFCPGSSRSGGADASPLLHPIAPSAAAVANHHAAAVGTPKRKLRAPTTPFITAPVRLSREDMRRAPFRNPFTRRSYTASALERQETGSRSFLVVRRACIFP